MSQSLSGMGGSFQKSLNRMNRRRAARRHVAQKEQIGQDVQRERKAQEAAKRQRRTRKAMEERREAISQFLRTGLRVETLLAGLRRAQQSSFTRLWVPRVVALVAVASLAGNLLQYVRYSPWRPLVTVGHRVVRQRDYMALLDSTAGKTVLDKVIYQELIQQAATGAGLLPTPQDVDMRIADLRRRNPTGLPPDDQLWDQVRMQMALENLRMQGTTATNAEIEAYYAQHKDLFTVPAHAQTTLVVTTNAATAARAAALLSAGKADAAIATLPGMRVAGVGGFKVNIDSLPPAVRQQVGQTVMALPIGSVKTLRIAPNIFFTLKPQLRVQGQVASLPLVREEVARLVRLQKSPTDQVELAQLYRASPPSFDMAKYSRYVDVPTADGSTPPPDPKTASLPSADTP